MNGACNCTLYLAPPSRGPGEGSKGQISLYLRIKDIKHIEGNFHSVPWVMPQGRDLAVLGMGKI